MEEKVQPQERYSRLKAVLWLAAVVVAFYGASLAAAAIARAFKLSPLAAVSVGQVGIMIVAVVFALIDGGGFRNLGVTAPWKAYDIAAVPGVIMAHLVGGAITAGILAMRGYIKPTSGQEVTHILSQFGNYSGGTILLVTLGLALQAGIGEELLFRGYIITRLERLGLGAWPCILLSALIFGAVHIPGYGWALALPKAVGLGLAAGIYFWYRRNLAPLMIAHTLIDFFSFMLVFLAVKLHLPMQ